MRVPGWQYRNTVLVLTVGAMFGTMVARIAISPLVPRIIDAFGVNKSAIGVALTGMWGAYALMQFPSGVLSERFGERKIILAALGFTGLGSILLSQSFSYPTFVLFALFIGASAGLHFVVGTSFLSRLFAARQGMALGFHAGASSIAGLLAPIAAIRIGARYGWRAGVLLGTITLPLFVLYAWRIRPTPPEHPDLRLRDRFDAGVIAELMGRPEIAYTTAVAVLANFSWQAFAAFFPTYLIEYWSIGSARASLIFGAVFALSIACFPGLGRLSDLLGRDYVLAGSLAAAVVGYALFFSGTGPLYVVPGVVTLAIGISYGGVVQSRFMDDLDSSERGTGFGIVRTISMTVGATGSVVTGVLADTTGWPIAYGFVVALLLVAAVSLVANRALGLGY